MSFCNLSLRSVRFLALLLLPLAASAGNPFIIGGGLEADTEDGRALNAFADVALTEATFVSVLLGRTQAEGLLEDLETRRAAVSLDHWFGAVGLRASYGIWGDPDRVESGDTGLEVYWQNEDWRLALRGERRDIDITFEFRDLQGNPQRRTGSVRADGLGASLRYRWPGGTSLYLSAIGYDYSRDISLLANLDLLSIRFASTLSLAGSLLDHDIAGGVEWEAGPVLLDVEVSRQRSALDKADVDSVSAGVLWPVADRLDLQLRAGRSDAEDFGGATFMGLYFFLYGGD